MGQIVFNIVVMIVLALTTIPITIYGVRIAKRHLKTASTFAALLLVFGVGMRVDPPPPPTIEATKRDDEEAPDDEPK